MERRMFKISGMQKRETEDGKLLLEGYFAKFNEPYNVFDDWVETISPGAFKRALEEGRDVKVLWNHDTNIPLGSTGANTAMLKEDGIGLFGSVEINRNDTDAMNAYARVLRGDVTGCSFGFDIGEMTEEIDDEGIYRTTIKEALPLYEVSPCTFPAYKSTEIVARNREQVKEFKKKRADIWKSRMKKKLKGEQNA